MQVDGKDQAVEWPFPPPRRIFLEFSSKKAEFYALLQTTTGGQKPGPEGAQSNPGAEACKTERG